MIFWFAASCIGLCGSERRARQRQVSLNTLARQAALLIFLRAAEFLGRHRYDRPPPAYGRKHRRRGLLRALTGVQLRRALRHHNPFVRMSLLIDALRHLDANARVLARRLRSGLTRAWGRAPTPQPAEALVALCASALCAADTS